MSSRREKMDPRIRRTRDALGDALLALMTERRFELITVQDVLDRAGVGRSTFYVHYRDKDDLFTSDIDEFWAFITNRLLDAGEQSDRIAPVRELFSHVGGMSELLVALRSAKKYDEVEDLGRLHFARAISRRLAMNPRTTHLAPPRRDAIAHAQAGAIMSMLDWWLSAGQPLTAAEVDDLFHRSFWSGAGRL